MSALIVYQGLEERFRTIPGLQNIILGEPTALHELPCLYTAFYRFERTQHGQITGMRYYFVHRLLLRWQDFPQAEMQLITMLNLIPAAIDADQKLGGRLPDGLASITDGTTGFITIGETKYRIVDYTSNTLEKQPYKSGI